MSSNIDPSTHVEHPQLTPILGEPNAVSLRTLEDEINANAISIPNPHEDNGYLSLVHSPQGMTALGLQPVPAVTRPANVNIPANTPTGRTQIILSQHRDAVKKYQDRQIVNRFLVQQIVAAIEPQYLASLRNSVTRAIDIPIWDILTHLWTTYGRVTNEMLDEESQRVSTFVYDVRTPIDTVFNLVDDLIKLSRTANIPISEEQTISKAFVILNKTGRFATHLQAWNEKPQQDKTWLNFKSHFRAASLNVRNLNTVATVGETWSQEQQANLIQNIVEGIRAENISTDHEHGTANNANTTAPPDQFTMMMQMMQQQNQQLQQMMQNMMQGNQNGNGRGNGSRNRNRQRNLSKYCWTHGACAHPSSECNNPIQGHVATATFENRQGGSTRNVPRDRL